MNKKVEKFKVILITGASSGIGEALALRFSKVGRVLILTGRNEARLNEVVEKCREKGAVVIGACVDVADPDAMAEFVNSQDGLYPIDLVVANAGISAGTGGVLEGEDPDQVRHVFDVNLGGVLNTIEPLRRRMVARGSGHIAIVSSLAGYLGWPGAPAYCGSKAAVRVYGEALRGNLKKSGVVVTVICPGFVKSRMTAVNEFPMPFLMDTQRAVAIIEEGLAKNKSIVAFPSLPYLFVKLLTILPDVLVMKLLEHSPSKKAKKL